VTLLDRDHLPKAAGNDDVAGASDERTMSPVMSDENRYRGFFRGLDEIERARNIDGDRFLEEHRQAGFDGGGPATCNPCGVAMTTPCGLRRNIPDASASPISIA
jgi:hypothetical protein